MAEYRSIMYFMRKNNVVGKVYNPPFIPPDKSRVEGKDSQGNTINLVVTGNATYRYGTDEDIAKIFIDLPVNFESDSI